MGAQATDEAMPPSPFADGTGFCSVCLYRTRLWVAADDEHPAAWLCGEEDTDRPRLGAAPPPPAPAAPPRAERPDGPPGTRGELAPTTDEHELACRARNVRRVQAMSRDLTRSPEEWVGRESHTMLLGGPLVDVIHDGSAPPELRAWARSVSALMRDLPTRRRLQEQHLSPEALAAADRSWDGEL